MNIKKKVCISKVKIKNFRGYGENIKNPEGFFIFDYLDSSMVLLSGHNGFGKTSFFEAIEWCLTDNIHRLSKLIDLYGVTGLRNKHYLKYYSPNDDFLKRNNRQIEVVILFDNGIEVRRTSRSNTLRLSEKSNNYSSDLYINGKKINKNSLSELVELSQVLINNGELSLLDSIIRSNFLGQENINEFLRTDMPEKRKSLIMRLLSYDKIENIYERANTFKNSHKIAKKKNLLEKQTEDLKHEKESINSKFKSYNLNNIEDYFIILNNNYKSIIKNIESNLPQYKETLAIKDISFSPENVMVKLDELLGDIKRYKQVIENNNRKQETIRENLNKLKRVKDIEKYIQFEKDKNELELLRDFDIEKNKDNINRLQLESKSFTNDINILNQKINNINLLNFEFINSLFNTLIEKTYNLDEKFWEDLINLKNFSINIFEKYKEFECTAVFFNAVNKINNIIEVNLVKEEYKRYNELRQSTLLEIQSVEETRNLLLSINTDYAKALLEVKNFIIKNKDIDKCPVCLNENLSGKLYEEILSSNITLTTFSEKLLKIIDNSISSGNSKIRVLEEKLSTLKETHNKINNYIQSQICSSIQKFLSENKLLYEGLKKDLILLLKNGITELSIKKTQTDERINIENENYKAYVNLYSKWFNTSNEDSQILKNKIELKIAGTKEYQLYFMKKYNYLTVPTINQLNDEIAKERTSEFEKYYNQEIQQLEAEVNSIENFNNELNKLIDETEEKVLKYKLDEKDYSIIQKYQGIDNTIAKNEITNQYLELFESVNTAIIDSCKNIYSEITDKILKNHKLINWIYEYINPHITYKSAQLNIANKGILITDEKGEICLDHIYSSAQMNILALSIFLGIGLDDSISNIGQLYLDDPIQSMDDVKIHSFIDLLRGILDAKVRNKKLIISTHDDNFAQLLAIKMRNRNIIHYNFESYNEEGPIYKLI